MVDFFGRSGELLLFTHEDRGVVVDSSVDLIVASGDVESLRSSRYWVDGDYTQEAKDIASVGINSSDFSITASVKRMYTIPRGVQQEAKKALEWRKEHGRGGTPVGLNTARTLAKGGQIGIEKIRHIAKYFPRHEVDKKGKGWKPSEDSFPSNGRIAWALWGGDAAWRWSRAIVERVNKDAITAGGYDYIEAFPNHSDEPNTYAFEEAYELEDGYGPEFLARVHLDGSGMDRLYKIDADGQAYLWDDGRWDDFGKVGTDIWEYDSTLDDGPTPTTHVVIDPESAIYLAAKFDKYPGARVTVDDIDYHEAQLIAQAIESVDWDFIDSLTAAGSSGAVSDGDYTEEERSQNAAQQLRDATGRFATAGSRVRVGGQDNLLGKISKVNTANGTVDVNLDDGRSLTVSAKSVSTVDPSTTATPTSESTVTPIDTSGILGEPRTPANRASAQIPGTLPAMTSNDLSQLLSNWPSYVQSQRAKFKSAPSGEKVGVQAKNSLDQGNATNKATVDAYEHPLLKEWLKGKDRDGHDNSTWYQPLVSAAVAEKPKAVTPDTSDVQPIYMAVVDADDPRAVLSLISLVPASDQSTAPMVYEREDGKWVRDPQTLADLNSPTPPPVVPLDSETLNDVLKQVDMSQGVTASLVLSVLFGDDVIVAAGRSNKNLLKAEKLRRYWTRGAGAAKIRWGQGGDWKRCVRQLTRYLGPRAKGYCQARHKDALGYYTSTHAKMLRPGSNLTQAATSEVEEYISDVFETEVSDEQMQTPLSQILTEADALYDFAWEPEQEIIFALQDLATEHEDDYALLAAGGADRNRGGAEKLRRYWTVGKGGMKIRWGTPGDWTRCVRNLQKYLGPRAKGYCALRHKEMNGMWPGDKRNRKEFSILASGAFLLSEEEILANAALRASQTQAKARVAAVVASLKLPTAAVFDKPAVERTDEMEQAVEVLEPVDTQDIHISDLTPSQESVELENVIEVEESDKPVDVLITADGPVLVDGHHRTTAHKLNGDDTVPANIYKVEDK